jgi:hypothetical protein
MMSDNFDKKHEKIEGKKKFTSKKKKLLQKIKSELHIQRMGDSQLDIKKIG